MEERANSVPGFKRSEVTMGWITDDGLHEGYIVPEFRDGQRGVGVIAGDVPLGDVIVEADYFSEPPHFDTRPASEVVGWRLMCDCRSNEEQPLPESHRWVGDLITRVAFPQTEDVAAGRVFADDEEVVLVHERGDVAELIRSLWSEQHVRPDDAMRILKEARARAALANRDLDRAMATALEMGIHPRAIERAAGIYPLVQPRHPSQVAALPRRVPGLTHQRSGPQL